jgi:hypothetical protein
VTRRAWFWRLCRIGTLLLFAGVVLAGYLARHPAAGWCALALLITLHATELRISLRLPVMSHVTRLRTIVMTLLFGFTWWLPVSRGLDS